MDKKELQPEILEIISENSRRIARNSAPFDPITGEGSIGDRIRVEIKGFPIPIQWIPVSMLGIPLIKSLISHADLDAFIAAEISPTFTPDDRLKVIDRFVRLRSRHDFPFWAALFVWIKNKGGGQDVLFRLTRPQRRFVERLEELRIANKPIRLILLKARQWGGSTTSQLYMAWLQLIHKVGLNSLIIAQQTAGSDEIRDMFNRMLLRYPLDMLHRPGEPFNPKEPKMVSVGLSGIIHAIPQRNCKIKIGTAKNPDSCRGGDYNLVHCSEVGVWEATEKKSPEDIVRSACSGVLFRPYTMIIYESTANGTGNFFELEYNAARKGESQFEAMFISWFDIDQYAIPFSSEEEKHRFALNLWNGRLRQSAPTDRQEPGRYLWWLWEKGATLEAINWYIVERAKYHDHGDIASEYPSDDIEAFVHSGARVFDKYNVDKLKPACKPPKFIGDVYADFDSGKEALRDIRFRPDSQGFLWIWVLPEIDPDESVSDRYLAVVDIGGRSSKADFSVITIFDRLFMAEGGKPVVVAQWYGHIDIDILAWKAAQIAAFYDNALLVIESNTLETRDRDRSVDGDQSQFILNQLGDVYPNLYARSAPEDAIIEGRPLRYGFHTNINTKPMIISTLVKVIREQAYIERDKRCLDEYITYERKPNGAYGAIKGAHDDILMTRAIGLHIAFFEMPLPKIIPRKKKASFRRPPVSEASI